jgi:hypothetical protein
MTLAGPLQLLDWLCDLPPDLHDRRWTSRRGLHLGHGIVVAFAWQFFLFGGHFTQWARRAQVRTCPSNISEHGCVLNLFGLL